MEEGESSGTWKPEEGGAFRRWTASSNKSPNPIAKTPLVARLTKDILETFQICNPSFKYSESLNPKRFLTTPSIGALNNGYDNANSDLILHVNLVLINTESKQRYVVKDMLGQGTFGQVARCWVSETDSYVAVKIIKNQPAYYQQALVEVAIVKMLNQKFDPDDKHHIVRILDNFVYQQHLCISFEMLGSNLFELIKANNFKGLSLSIVQMFSRQILHALVVMKDAGIIHCDLKPENILITGNVKPAEIKIIDFGSACAETRTVYSYIQSRYYRSPEVLLGYPYTTAIDMWSFGCIIAELFLGLPLFPGASEYDLIKRMIEILSGQPPDGLLIDSKNTSKFFMHLGAFHQKDDECEGGNSAFRVLTEDEWEAKESKPPSMGKRYFKCVKLEDIIVCYPFRKTLCQVEITKEKETRLALVDLLRGLLEFDPGKRWSPLQASRHPFLTGERFLCPYKPPIETPRIPVSRTVAVDYNKGGRHWLGAGLSPQVTNVNNCHPHNSPHFQMGPFVQSGSYGSVGSHGSYNDNAALGSSYGSFSDFNNAYAYYSPVGPSGMSPHSQPVRSYLGGSPDARLRPQLSHGNGFGPSSTGSFGPMSLGASPSQFTPPSSQMQYGSTSPARAHAHGSPLGKAAAIGQYNRRRHNVYPGNFSAQPHENTSQQWQGQHTDGLSCSYQDAYSRGNFGSPRSTLPIPNYSNRRQQIGFGNGLHSGSAPGNYQTLSGAGAHNLNVVASHSSEVSCDKPESSSSVPNPGDWDPCYSEELLLQEENFEVRPLMYVGPKIIGSSSDITFATNAVSRLSLGNNQASAGPNFISSNNRTDGQFQAFSAVDGNPSSAHDNMRSSYNRLPNYQQSSTSRFSQQPIHRGTHIHSSSIRNEQNHQRSQAGRSGYSVADTQSSNHPIFPNGLSWGRRAAHPISTTIPASHERKEYGRI